MLAQRHDADADDVARVEELARRLGGATEVRRTDGPEALGSVIAALDGRTLVVCGGDGSMHLAVNRLHAGGHLPDTRVALFPAGTGNDLAHTLGLPLEPDAMARLLRQAATRPLDLLELQGHGVAVNAVHAGVGVDAAERSQGLPDGLGAVAYPLGALLAGVGASGFDGRVHVDDHLVRPTGGEATLMVLVCNGRTIGGGHVFAPDADPSDGLLDVVVCHATGVAARAAFGLAVTRGTHLERDDVAIARGRSVQISGPPLAYNVDGELWLDEPLPELAIRVRPAALALVASP